MDSIPIANDYQHLGEILLNSAVHFADENAIRYGDRCYSFQSVAWAAEKASIQLSELMPSGRQRIDRLDYETTRPAVESRDKVALLIPNCPTFPVFYFATLWLDAVVVPINPLLSADEIRWQLEHSDARWIVVHESLSEKATDATSGLADCELIPVVDDVVDDSKRQGVAGDSTRVSFDRQQLCSVLRNRDPHETAVILYTSGSSGKAKGVELTHRNLLHNSWCVSEEKFSSRMETNRLGPGQVGLAALPLTHAFGLSNLLNGMWYQGGCVSLLKKFHAPDVLDLFRNHSITFFAGVPTMYFDLVEAALSSTKLSPAKLRFCVCGGAPLSRELKIQFRNLFAVTIQESYGMTEASPMVSCQRMDEAASVGNVGRPVRDVQVRILDENDREVEAGSDGELFVKGPNVFRSYYRSSPADPSPIRDGWYATGDLARLNTDGTLSILERKTEVISRGGYKVYPKQVEDVLLALETVREAVVLGVPDDRLGQEIKAVVSLRNREGQKKTGLSNEDVVIKIQNWCQNRLAAYKCPRIIEIMDELPKGSTGKISRVILRRGIDPADGNGI